MAGPAYHQGDVFQQQLGKKKVMEQLKQQGCHDFQYFCSEIFSK